MKEGDLSGVKKFAMEQQKQGAKVLDVNMGLSGIDEQEMMEKSICELVRFTRLPLCIDSTDPKW